MRSHQIFESCVLQNKVCAAAIFASMRGRLIEISQVPNDTTLRVHQNNYKFCHKTLIHFFADFPISIETAEHVNIA